MAQRHRAARRAVSAGNACRSDRPDVDALDQGGEEGALACSGQLGPALPDLGGARDELALRRQIRKLCRLVDAAGIEKPMAHSAGHELLDLSGWDAQPGGLLGLLAV